MATMVKEEDLKLIIDFSMNNKQIMFDKVVSCTLFVIKTVTCFSSIIFFI